MPLAPTHHSTPLPSRAPLAGATPTRPATRRQAMSWAPPTARTTTRTTKRTAPPLITSGSWYPVLARAHSVTAQMTHLQTYVAPPTPTLPLPRAVLLVSHRATAPPPPPYSASIKPAWPLLITMYLLAALLLSRATLLVLLCIALAVLAVVRLYLLTRLLFMLAVPTRR